MNTVAIRLAVVMLTGSLCSPVALGQSSSAWHHTFSGEPLDVQPVEGESTTQVASTFLATGVNAYNGDPGAIADGATLFLEKCAICHGIEARGRMAPSLVDDSYVYDKNRQDKGMFETVWGGAAAAMTPFRGVLTQDEILRVMAYVRSLAQRGKQ